MKRLPSIPVIVLLILVCSSTALAGKSRSITRESDPVIVVGKDAGKLVGKRIEGLRAYVMSGGSFSPIPFQIDERTDDGDYVFHHGKEKNPGDGDGLFNGADELVLMAKDLGDRVDDVGAHVSGYESAALLVVTDPQDNRQGFAYVLSFASNPPAPSAIDYATIDPAANRITTLFYVLGFSKDAPMAMDELRVTAAGGGDGVDYCDRLKARLHCSIAGVDLDRNEEQFYDELVAWIDGPVRVVRRTRSMVELFWNIPIPTARLDNLYYYNSFSFPTEVNLPVDVGFIIKDAVFRISVDSPRLSGERRYRNELYPDGVIQDGKMSEREQELAADRRPFKWSSTGTVSAGGKDVGAWFNRLIVEGDNPDWKPRVFYIDDENHLDAPDEEPGSFGNAGYQIDGLTNLGAGTYRLESVMYSMPTFEPSMVDQYLRILDHPVKVELKELN